MSLINELSNLNVISAHEHISSILSFGQADDMFFPSDNTPSLLPCTNTSLNDLVMSPYYATPIFSAGYQWENVDFSDFSAFEQWYSKMSPCVARTQNIGTFLALNLALNHLYDADFFNIQEMWKANLSVSEHYQNYPLWYRRVMNLTHTKYVIKPVHPQYFQKQLTGFEAEFVKPIARIDSLLGKIEKGRLNFSCLFRSMGVTPESIDDCIKAIDRFFQLIKGRAVGIKQLQAYSRTLSVSDPSYADAKNAFPVAISEGGNAMYLVQDYLHRYILSQADKDGMAYQIHTGMTTLSDSNPAYLEPLIRQYPNIRFVLLHCYPYIKEASYLARSYANCYLDTSWLALQGNHILTAALTEYLAMVPLYKVTISIDATSLEEYYGGMTISKKVLCDTLENAVNCHQLTPGAAMSAAAMMMGENAVHIYDL